jgi:eukaryotic-like serine/threonine-protein kinase
MEFRGTDRFVIQRRLGEGGFGVVYEARDVRNDSVVALKTLRHFTPDSLYRFKREFRSLTDITHPNLVQLYELVSDSDEWFFTMELVSGKQFIEHVWGGKFLDDETVRTSDPLLMPGTLHRNAPPPSPAHIDRLEAALPQLIDGVAALHRAGSIHRDLKPSNVLVSSIGRVVLLDFGLLMDIATDTTQSLQVVGTPAYMSPEQAAGLPLTPASDWYSAGVMLFQCLTGELPYGGSFLELIAAKQTNEPPYPSRLASGVPPHLDALCRDLLQGDPERRPRAEEILERLAASPSRVSQTTTTPRTAPGTGTLFIGRDAQLSELRAAFDETLTGNGVTVCLHGLSGIGKTSLARRFLDDIREKHPNAAILTGRCFERESVPYKGLDSLIDALARHLLRLPHGEAEAVLPRDIFALAQLFPVLRQLEELVPAKRRAAAVPDSQELRRRAFAALRDLFARLGDKEPAVLFVDDLQWGDIDSADLLAYVVREPDAPSILFIASYRSDEVNSSPFLRAFRAEETLRQMNVLELTVDQLSVEESQELAVTLLKDRAPQFTAVAASIAAEAGGSPFFIDELVRSAEAEGETLLQRKVSLAEMIRPRLERLPPDAERLLQLVSVNGQPVPSRILKRAAPIAEHEPALALLRAEHLIRTRETEGDVEIETYHDRIRETVVKFLDGDVLREHHRRLAAAFEAVGGADAEMLADHFIAGGEAERAIEYTIVAAGEAERVLAFDRAARLYRRALDLIAPQSNRRAQLQVKLGDALTNAGRGAEAAETYLAITGLSLRETLELRHKAAQQLLFTGHIDEGLLVVESVLHSVGMHLPKTRRGMMFSILLGRAKLALRGTRFRERDEIRVAPEKLMRVDTCWSVSVGLGVVDTMRGAVFQTHHALGALNAGELHRAARAMCMEAGYSAVRGSRARRKTVKLLAFAHALVERANTPYANGLMALIEGICGFLEGRWRHGFESSMLAEQILLDGCTGVTWELDSARFFSFYCLLYLGEMKEMAARYPFLVNDAQERGDLYALTMFRGLHSHFVYLNAGNPQDAREISHDAINRWSQAGSHVHYMWELWAMADIAIYQHRGTSAWTGVEQRWPSMKAALSLHVQFTNVSMLDLRGRSALAAIDEGTAPPDESRRLLGEAERAARLMERERTDWGHALAELLRAGIEMRRGNKDAALRRLRSADQRLGAVDMRFHRFVAQWRLGELIGGDEGRDLIAASEAFMRAEGVREPDRLAYVYAPWTAQNR